MTIYTIEREKHGWIVTGHGGIPVLAMAEINTAFRALCPPRGGLVAHGVSHHLRHNGLPDTVLVIVPDREAMVAWEAEIEATLARRPPAERWWLGTDVGLSSAWLFSRLAEPGSGPQRYAADFAGRGAFPMDWDDFHRCVRMVDAIGAGHRLAALEVDPSVPRRWRQLLAEWPTLKSWMPQAIAEHLQRLSRVAD